MKKADGEFELTDIEVEEISFVDRPANKRKFPVVKRDGETGGIAMTLKLTKDEKVAMAKAMLEIKDRVEHIDKAVGEAEEVEEVNKSDRAGIDVLVKALEESLQVLKKKDDDPPKTDKQQVECPSCHWKGEMPEDGKCPKCEAALKKDGDADKDKAEQAKRYGEVKDKLTEVTATLARLKAENKPSPAITSDAAEKIAKTEREIEDIKKRIADVEKGKPEVVGSQQTQNEGGGATGDIWAADDMSREIADEEEAAKKK